MPGSKANTTMPWMVIYPLAEGFSFDPVAAHYKGPQWIVHNIIDTAAKGGSFQVGVGPDALGRFHPTAVAQIKQVGVWMKTREAGIYATRSRAGDLWREGDSIRYTRSKDKRTVYCYALDWPGNSLRLTTVSRQREAGSPCSAIRSGAMEVRFSDRVGKGEMPEAMASEARRPTDYAAGAGRSISEAGTPQNQKAWEASPDFIRLAHLFAGRVRFVKQSTRPQW